MNKKVSILDLSFNELHKSILEIGLPKFRSTQIFKWLYQKRTTKFHDMSNISKDLQSKLSNIFDINRLMPSICSVSENRDAIKFGYKLDHSDILIESVLLLDSKRRTACVSSQLGCGLGCTFCETAKLGFIRNLTSSEIISQLLAMNDYLLSKNDRLITNIVFMGMGEALSNFENFVKAVDVITHRDALNLSPKRITVSTAGLVPSMKKLRHAKLGVQMAISLNTYSNEKRNKIMPINTKYPIEEIIKEAELYARQNDEPITFEYVLMHKENDTDDAINALVKLLSRIPCKLNIIPINTNKNSFITPDHDTVQIFANKLYKKGITVTVRKSRGKDISGACGQLAGRLKDGEAN